MSWLAALVAVPAIALGVFFFVAGTVGLVRFPDTLSRLHALAKADNLGLGLIALGLMALSDSLSEALKLLLVWALVLFGGGLGAQLLGIAVRRGERDTAP